MGLVYPLSETMLTTLHWCIFSMPLWLVWGGIMKWGGATDEQAWMMSMSHFRVGAFCFWMWFPVAIWEQANDDTPYNPWPEGYNPYTHEWEGEQQK